MIDRARHLGAAAGWIAVLLPLAVVLVSVSLAPESNWTVRTALAGFCVLAIARPDAALLITLALVGFGTILSHLAGVPPLRVTEVLVVGSLAGCCARAVPHGSSYRRALSNRISVPIVLFAATVVASAIVWLRVHQVETTYPSAYLQAFLHFLTRDYFVQPGDFAVLVTATVILEGLALYVVAAALCELDSTFFERALRMLILGGAGLALMSVVRLAEIILRSPDAVEAMRATSAGLRISPQIGDYIAAGSYFSLCWLVALGMAVAAARRRILWVLGGAPLVAALYLTGSRSVIVAALVGLVVLGSIMVRQRAAAAVRAIVVFALVTVLVMVLSYKWTVGRDVAGTMAMQSVTVRVELIRAGLQVLATRPVFGVGLDRFFLLAGDFASPQLRALWQGRMNPHNDFLRFGAELGLVGLALFLWILVFAINRMWKGLVTKRDARLAGLAGGLAAFLVTSVASNPLMVREVSYVFWIALGLAVGRALQLRPSMDAQERGVSGLARGKRHGGVRWIVALLLGSLIVFSIPFRARREVASVDLTYVTYGLFEWGTEPDGAPSRWTGPRATLFVDPRARLVDIPLSSTAPLGAPQQVELRVDGRLADRFVVGQEWRRVRTVLPASDSSAARRIDLAISPSWVPAQVLPGNRDHRVLGVKIGKISVMLTPGESR